MNYKIPVIDFPPGVEISRELTREENPEQAEIKLKPAPERRTAGAAFHEKKGKNLKTNQGGSYLRKMKTYKKPKTRGDKNFNKRKRK